MYENQDLDDLVTNSGAPVEISVPVSQIKIKYIIFAIHSMKARRRSLKKKEDNKKEKKVIFHCGSLSPKRSWCATKLDKKSNLSQCNAHRIHNIVVFTNIYINANFRKDRAVGLLQLGLHGPQGQPHVRQHEPPH